MISVNERSCSLTIVSTDMAADLARYGIRPNKTFSTQPAQVAIDLERHYWRGVIDGDGDFARSGVSLKLVGDYDIVLAFQQFVLAYCPQVTANIHKRENIFTLTLEDKLRDVCYWSCTVMPAYPWTESIDEHKRY